MQCSSVLSGVHALQIFQGQDLVSMQKSPYNDLYITLFNKLSTFTFNRCYLVCRQWKEFCSLRNLSENRVTELVKQIFCIKRSCYIHNAQLNADFFSSRDQFYEGISKYDDFVIAKMLANLKTKPLYSLGDFASECHEQMIQNREQLLNFFSAWIPTIEPGYDGILRVTFFGCNKFYFEVHCLFLKGSDNMHYNYRPSFFDPKGCDMNETNTHITGKLFFGRNQNFKSLSIRFDMPFLTWSLKDVGNDLSQIFDKHVDDLAKKIYTKFKISV